MAETILNLETFNPTIAELEAMVASTKGITVTDFEDKGQLALVKENRIKLRDARVVISKKGKELREGAIAFQKAVISKEKELVGIIEPEEERLAGLEEEAKILSERKARAEALPDRKAKLAAIKDGIEVTDAELLDMDTEVFVAYANQRQENKNAKDREELDRREREVKEKEDAQKREAEIKEREEKARKEERERAEFEAKQKAQREVDEKAAAEKVAADKKAKEEADAKAEKERLEKEESYQAFLSENGVTAETKDTFIIQRNQEEVKLYKLVAVLPINKVS